MAIVSKLQNIFLIVIVLSFRQTKNIEFVGHAGADEVVGLILGLALSKSLTTF